MVGMWTPGIGSRLLAELTAAALPLLAAGGAAWAGQLSFRGLAAVALATLAALARRRQRGLRITTGMSRFVPAWYLS